ncbi:MAG: hypothetical protein P0Y53_11635 [Candidatus Pseudobacter hemicellulosilyticus]|uniref:Lipoprotein n=1 Tax=Candidatus Pseudobacter hemicellulosilyticus TaxID=3121375 RepID=A0AAJ5WYZ3_9BACT|nr:MAG: hypothetical protein P0Y53_11635 [Pseudobacter sp.]
MKRSLVLRTGGLAAIASMALSFTVGCNAGNAATADATAQPPKSDTEVIVVPAPAAVAVLDTALYDAKMSWMVNGDSTGKWPVKANYPKPGAILPMKRILAYYGNLYSTRMGILGELAEKDMLAKLQGEVKKWHAADSTTEVVPALHYIAVTAQGSAGADGKYRLRMPHKEIDKVLAMAEKINALVFIDVQVGLSTLQAEIPQLEKYLKMPHVHLGIDPEFSMKTGKKPGSVIGSFDAADINYTTDYLAKLVKENNLPPKVLVVHRFTQAMVTNYKQIKLQPEIQIVMDMDGWGAQARKISTYRSFIHREPVQFTGFKLFYKNDFRETNSRIMTPEEVLKLKPQPVYIQYQ